MTTLNELPVITQDTVMAKINIALTKKQLSVQKLQDEADALEFTEENIPVISAYLAKIAAMEKSIEETHKEGKAPYLDGGRVWDAAKNSSLATTTAIKNPVKQKFDKLCAEVDRKRREAEAEEAKRKAILAGIESNVISFSTKIASCTTNDELLSIERLINLEKSPSNAGKYGEYHEQAIEKYDTVLKPILKDQKEKIQKQEAIKKQIEEAEKNNDVEKLDELNEKFDSVTDEIIQNQVKVQEEALNNAPMEIVPVAEEIFADTKSRRSYTIEIDDEKVALKKAKDLLEITINKDAANVVLKTLKDTNAFKDNSEVVLNGIKYSEVKSYK